MMYKGLRKYGVTEIHSNRSNSSFQNNCTPSYQFMANVESRFCKENDTNKTIQYDNVGKLFQGCAEVQRKKTKSKTKLKKKKGLDKDKRPGSALGYSRKSTLRSNPKIKNLRK